MIKSSKYIKYIQSPSPLIIFVLFLSSIASCKKLVEVNPPRNELVGTNIFQDNASAAAALTGVYQRLDLEGIAGGKTSIGFLTGLSSDELVNFDGNNATLQEFYTNKLTPDNPDILTIWSQLYNYIYSVNKIIEGLDNNDKITVELKDQLQGEALYLRAFFYFNLTNLFGNVPLIVSTDYETNMKASRTASVDVYKQILKDLVDAESKLPNDYRTPSGSPTTERVRPNKYAAASLLARVYLYLKNYQNAASEASKVIDNKSLYDTVPLNSVFLKNSKEAIWQIQSVVPSLNTYDGYTYILSNGPNSFDNPVYLSDFLVNSFNPIDLRLKFWISQSNGYYYPYKYKVSIDENITEYNMILRLGEQYLIRAEARARLEDYPGSLQDINLIRHRAGLQDTASNNLEGLLGVIIKEKRTELFSEWGQRWFDLKRMSSFANSSQSLADELMPVICDKKGSKWSTNSVLYPIPRTELANDPNLNPQNEGYN